MRKRFWLPALLGLTVGLLPATAQEPLSLAEAVGAALTSHPSVVQAEAAVHSAALSLRLAEIDHGAVTVSLSATPASGRVNLDPPGADQSVADTFDADASATVSATVELPWGMSISGSYTAGFELDDLDSSGPQVEESFTDAQSLSISQDLLHPGPLAPTAVALAGRRSDLRLARLRLQRARSDVAQQVAATFLDLTERTATLAVLEERLTFAESDLVDTQSRVEQQAAGRIDLLAATIAVMQRRNAVTDARAALALDSAAFFADVDLPQAALTAPVVDLDALRQAAADLLAAPIPAEAAETVLAVLEAEAALDAADVQAQRTALGSLPSLSLSLDYSKISGAPGLGRLSVSLTGSYTLFDGGRQAASLEQAEAQVASARRSLVSARSTAQNGLDRSRNALASAAAAEELAALQLERARLQAEQANRQHAAGLISDTALAESVLALREADDAARAAVHMLGGAYLSLAVQQGVDLHGALAAITA